MGRSTKGRVNITGVNTNNIKDITDSDKPFIKQRGRKASEFFKDLTESGNEIYNDFIDEAYCPADEGGTKKDKLTRAPYKWSQWRNYGGAEVDTIETIPEIFWANIIDSASGSDVERAPQTQEEFDIMNELNSIPGIVLYPSEEDINNQIDSSAINSRYLASSYQSTMFTGTRILNSKVATKVGIDYFANTSTNIPEFEIKVTPYVTDGISKIKYYRNVDVEGVITQEEKDTLLHIGGGLFLAIFGAKTIAELGPALIAWFNSLIGPFTPWGVIIKSLNQLWGKIWAWFLTLTEMPALATIASILEPIALFIGLILVADVVWDVFNPSAEILDMAYQYSNTVLGNYVFEDIALSEYSYGFGRKYQQPEGKETKLISQDGESKSYTLNSFNSGTSWSENNLFTRFPNQASGLPDKYLNWDFFPKSYQYDLDTPPPVIQYLVELVPVRNCKLSTNKQTAFIVMVVPDKYLAPKFEAITSVVGVKGKELYGNTSITFKNARYCDFIFLEDTSKAQPDNYTNLWGLLGDLFTDYNNKGVNTDINAANGAHNSFAHYNGRDISMNGFDLMSVKTKNIGMANWFTPYPDKFIVNFMREASPNIIYNQYFRTEYNSDISSKLTGLRQFWHTNEFVNISGGGAVCSGGIGLLYQHIPTVASGYYTLTLECSGDVYLKTGGSGSCFEYGVYTWNSDSDRYKTSQSDMDDGWHLHNGEPFGSYDIYIPECSRVSLVDDLERIKFSSGFYKIIVKVNNTGVKDISFAMTDGSSINTCKLQKLPNSKAAEGTKRGCYNLITQENQPVQFFYWKEGNFFSKTIEFIYDWAYNHTYSIMITPSITEETDGKISKIKVKWWKIDTTTEIVEYPFIEGEQLTIEYIGDNTPVFKAEVIFILDSAFKVEKPIMITNNDQNLLDVADQYAMLTDAIVDFSGTKLGSTYQLTKNWNFKKHKYRLKELNISNTQSSDSVENITSISDSINISNTNIGGFFAQLSSIPRVICENTNISKYGTGQSYYAEGTEPYIVWKNSKTQIEESSLNLLLNTLAYSNTWNGTLDIAGDNPEITNELALANIDILVGRNWNVIYNSSEEWTYEGVMTVGGNLGDPWFSIGSNSVCSDGELSYYYGNVNPLILNCNMNANNGIFFGVFSVNGINYLQLVLYVNGVYIIDSTVNVECRIDGIDYTLVYDNSGAGGGHLLNIGFDNPLPPVGEICEIKLRYTLAPTYTLTVTNGTSSGSYIQNSQVEIVANTPETGYQFKEWTGDTQYLASTTSSTTTVTMPAEDVSVEATYELIPTETVTIGGEEYETVTIGTQTWLKRNLHYNDSGGGIYAYNNSEANAAIYGRLYTWDAAMRVAASIDGWHLPSDAEWTTLTTYLGGASVAGGKLKETGTNHWWGPNTGATNETGFTALPGGTSNINGEFNNIRYYGSWWSATVCDATSAWNRYMDYYYGSVGRGNYYKQARFSVRLIKS